jgi:uncharacterized protein (TIGR02145 family)
MKRILTLFTAIILSGHLFSQAPQKMSYQAVIRNSNNALVINQSVSMKISILQTSANGTPVFVETQTALTNANGLVSVQIGSGTVVTGTLPGINWSAGPYFIKTETDPAGGTNYTIVGTSELLSVPFAMYAQNSGSSTPGPQGLKGDSGARGPQGPIGLTGPGYSSGTTKNQIMYWNNTAWVPLNPGSNGQILTLCNGELKWTNGGQCSTVSGITSLNCASATNIGTLTSGTAASGVSSNVPYTGGNFTNYTGQIINSTGVTGLTATLAAGNFANGNGSLSYNITGTPAGSGTASFALTIGGQTCTLTRTVNATGTSGSSNATCGAPSVHNPALTYGSLTDQNGNVYKTIVIGTQEWMAENLKASHYRNGVKIPLVTDATAWNNQVTGATCWYNNDSATFNCPWGKLYNRYAVTDIRNVCPVGWHVPNDVEWTTLITYLGGPSVAGGKMKTAGSQYYWGNPNIGADNSSGFSGLPGGAQLVNTVSSVFTYLESAGFWWSSVRTPGYGSRWSLDYGGGAATLYDQASAIEGYSVRCVKD